MVTKRLNTIGSNPLKAKRVSRVHATASVPQDASDVSATTASVPQDASDVSATTASVPQDASDVSATTASVPKDAKDASLGTEAVVAEPALPTRSADIAPRVRRSAKETEALFAAQLPRPEPQVSGVQKNAAAHAPVEQSPQNTLLNDRHREAMAIVKTWSQWSVVAGMTPVPILDSIVLSATQIKLIQLLCKHYNVPFEHKVALAVATGLVGSTATISIAGGMTRSLVRNVPVLGQLFNWTVEPALSFGSTYAIGATFVRHFEADGNLLSFKGEQMKAYAAEQYKKGKNLFLSKKGMTAA